jgi:Uma2 family endonuclease
MAMPVSLPPSRSIWTAADVDALQRDGERYEVLHGELLVTPSPAYGHQRAAFELAVLLRSASGAEHPVSVSAPALVRIADTTQLEPDLAVYAVAPHLRPTWLELPRPLLVVEFGSPSTKDTDRHRKRPAYISAGIPEVWTVDLDAPLIERWTPASEFPTTQRQDFDFQLTPAHPVVRITLQAVFGTPAA